MKIVGKVRIELRDAKTGKLKHISEEHNVVTDSVYNIINGALARAKRGNYNSIFVGSSTEEAIKQLFGGVMVFNRSIDTSHLVPDILEMSGMIGNGNQGGTVVGSSKKGTLRSATITADSAKFVWDFPSTVCNGTIASICLTSNKGGELGCNFDARDTTKNGESIVAAYGGNLAADVANTVRYDNDTRLFSISGEGTTGCWVVDGDSLVQYQWTQQASYKRVWSLADYKNMFKFNEYQAHLPAISPVSEEALQDAIMSRFFRGICGNYALAGDASYVQDNDNVTYTLTLAKYTKNGISNINVPMNNLITAVQAVYDRKGIAYETTPNNIVSAINNAISGSNAFTIDNKLIWFVGSMGRSEDEFLNIYIQDYDGSFVTLDQIQTDTAFFNLINKAGLPSSSGWCGFMHDRQNNNLNFRPVKHDDDNYVYLNDYLFYLGVDPNGIWGCYFHNRPFFYAKLNDIINMQDDTLSPKPYFRCLPSSQSSSTNGDFVSTSVLQTNYLATIQNQSNPAIKTPSDIMSITYTLTRTN